MELLLEIQPQFTKYWIQLSELKTETAKWFQPLKSRFVRIFLENNNGDEIYHLFLTKYIRKMSLNQCFLLVFPETKIFSSLIFFALRTRILAILMFSEQPSFSFVYSFWARRRRKLIFVLDLGTFGWNCQKIMIFLKST